jgi:hypothetical protein
MDSARPLAPRDARCLVHSPEVLARSSQPDPIVLRRNDLAQTESESTHERYPALRPLSTLPFSAVARGDTEVGRPMTHILDYENLLDF